MLSMSRCEVWDRCYVEIGDFHGGSQFAMTVVKVPPENQEMLVQNMPSEAKTGLMHEAFYKPGWFFLAARPEQNYFGNINPGLGSGCFDL